MIKIAIKNKSNIIIIFGICIIQILLASYFTTQKINFHVDEIATYSLANDARGGDCPKTKEAE